MLRNSVKILVIAAALAAATPAFSAPTIQDSPLFKALPFFGLMPGPEQKPEEAPAPEQAPEQKAEAPKKGTAYIEALVGGFCLTEEAATKAVKSGDIDDLEKRITKNEVGGCTTYVNEEHPEPSKGALVWEAAKTLAAKSSKEVAKNVRVIGVILTDNVPRSAIGLHVFSWQEIGPAV